MRLTYAHLSRHPRGFRHRTGLPVTEFDALVQELLPVCSARDQQRLSRPNRHRAIGGGTRFALKPREQVLLTVIWWRLSPMHEGLGLLFGVTDPTVGRISKRVLPLLAAAGRDSMRRPDPGKKHRRTLDAVLADTPELAGSIDTFEQAGQRPNDRSEADPSDRGKQKRHTHKTQVAVDETTGHIVDVSAMVRGPTADRTLLKASGLLERLPPGVGSLGDLADVGIAGLPPPGVGATPRRTPRGKPRPPEDGASKQAVARRRSKVEHRSGRMRCFQALTQRDRHHRQHTGRVGAGAGLVNRCLERKRR